MSSPEQSPAAIPENSLSTLLGLSRRAREATDEAVLRFMAVNDSHELVPYRQAGLWSADDGIQAVSGVVQLEANAAYAQWLNSVCQHVASLNSRACLIAPQQLPASLAADWDAWLPSFALWLPFHNHDTAEVPSGGLLLVRDTPWQVTEMTLLIEWMNIWHHACQAHRGRQQKNWRPWRTSSGAWWKQRRLRWGVGLALLLVLPVRLTVLAPGELVPANPTVIRAPMEGVVGRFHVQPNQQVIAGQALFDYDDAPLQSRLEVARQALAGAEAEYRQAGQLAVSDPKYKAQLALLLSKVDERRAEADYLQGQLDRAHVLAPHDGMVLFDDPSDWIGRPVNTGERIMRVATPGDLEVEAWLGLGDAIPLERDAPLSLYLNASPLQSVPATIRYVAYDAVQRADGNYAYRVRATLAGPTDHRVGLKGTAKISGRWVTMIYWITRRPLATIRQMIGW